MDRITVRISESLANQLKANSHSCGKTQSEVVRAALKSYLGKRSITRSAFDAASAAGLIGCARGLPKDQGTNRRYHS
jgi:metal-responsive CopG/Arc/MetJ family transcriptional regulator